MPGLRVVCFLEESINLVTKLKITWSKNVPII